MREAGGKGRNLARDVAGDLAGGGIPIGSRGHELRSGGENKGVTGGIEKHPGALAGKGRKLGTAEIVRKSQMFQAEGRRLREVGESEGVASAGRSSNREEDRHAVPVGSDGGMARSIGLKVKRDFAVRA